MISQDQNQEQSEDNSTFSRIKYIGVTGESRCFSVFHKKNKNQTAPLLTSFNLSANSYV